MVSAAAFYVMMMMGIAIFLLGFSVWAYRRNPVNLLEADERAFDEQIRVEPSDASQLQRLRPLVTHVGIVRRLAKDGGRYEHFEYLYEIWIIDSLGAVHDVWKTHVQQEAVRVALQLRRELDAELMDEDAVIV